ncbi:hypothetical protein K488DRAFT_77086 [Vararia minispora EC-137]|uniref:Uncharacterized protein n=1 Tax=Vararia minispora EC-137 TaxID=1314806 RepID=A0ACB8QSK7_9AGAM|nr:hypothetical protein K488DRAFT_77086 [Vararia minispora EC-137]
MVGASELSFRALVQSHGATLAYTQMLHPSRLKPDPEYLAFHRRDLSHSPDPVVVQICGSDADELLRGARKIANLCDRIDLNLGCPQDHAHEVSTLAHGLSVPVSVKMRLCIRGKDATLVLVQRLSAADASLVTLHARYASVRQRRHGPENLDVVKTSDIQANETHTGASGIMVGGTLLGNPRRWRARQTLHSVFENELLIPADISLECLELCQAYSNTASLKTMQVHVRHIVEFQWYVHTNKLERRFYQSGTQ